MILPKADAEAKRRYPNIFSENGLLLPKRVSEAHSSTTHSPQKFTEMSELHWFMSLFETTQANIEQKPDIKRVLSNYLIRMIWISEWLEQTTAFDNIETYLPFQLNSFTLGTKSSLHMISWSCMGYK